MLVARIVVNVDGHAAQCGDFARELVQPRVVLSGDRLVAGRREGDRGVLLALEGLRHGGGGGLGV